MEPNLDKAPRLVQPQMAAEMTQNLDGQSGLNRGPEASVSSQETRPTQPQAYASTPGTPMPQPSPPQASDQPAAGSQPLVAANDDDDKSKQLDQEWVNKAKAIVEKTKNDPFQESQEMGKAKAEYMRIRYGKQVKVVEDVVR